MTTVIHGEGLGKRYRRGVRVDAGLRHALDRLVRSPLRSLRGAKQETFWALKDVSLEVREGEVLGLIGRNGAGKTTLLKILSRITRPTEGWAEIRGRVRSLLEVGTGFHPELTGRENAYLSGSILGMGRREIDRKFDEIVAFAETEKFLDTPVKRYSSGMYVRLAFAVAAHLEPEILVVDEVLAVGDAEFQKKCLGKMQDVAQGGRTVLLVSHNMSAIRFLCDKAIFLDNGFLRVCGSVEDGIALYLRSSTDLPRLSVESRTGDARIQFTDFWIENDDGDRLTTVASGEPCTLVFGYRNVGYQGQGKVDVGFGLHSSSGERLLLLYASHLDGCFTHLHSNGQFRCRLPALPLATGRYGIFPRIEIDGKETDYPRDGIGWVDVEEINFYGTGRRMGQHGHAHAYYLTKGEWTECAASQAL